MDIKGSDRGNIQYENEEKRNKVKKVMPERWGIYHICSIMIEKYNTYVRKDDN